MAQRRLRVALDANVLIAGLRQPRVPFEVMRAAVARYFDLILPEQIVAETRRHMDNPARRAAREFFLSASNYAEVPMPTAEEVRQNLDLVRSAKDVPIGLALLAAEVDIFVTGDRDFLDPEATSPRLRARIRIIRPAEFLQTVLGWTPEAITAVGVRSWDDIGS